MKETEWDMGKVFERIEAATRTARAIPRPFAPGRTTYWPDFVRSYYEAYQDDARPTRQRPTARELTEFDEVIVWLAWLQKAGPEYPKIIWARAASSKASWRRLAKKMECSHTKVAYTFRVGVALLLSGLNAGHIEGTRAPTRPQRFEGDDDMWK